MNLFGGTINQLEKGLAYSASKQKAIASNIANVDTPGYKAQQVNFKDILNETARLQAYRTNPQHLVFNGSDQTFSYNQSSLSYRQNGNSVDMDKEQADLAENQIYYNALIDRISGKFNSLQEVVKGGR